MKEDHPLLHEVLTSEELAAFRRDTLSAGLDAVRRRRRLRRARQLSLSVAVPIIAAWVWLANWPSPQRSLPSLTPAAERPALARSDVPVSVAVPQAAATPPIKMITDQELLALFPDRTKALIGEPGRQRLVFLDGKPARGVANE